LFHTRPDLALVAGFDEHRVRRLTQRLAAEIAPPISRMHLLYFAAYRDPAFGTATPRPSPPLGNTPLASPTATLRSPAAFIQVVVARRILQFDAEASWSSIQ
jgi:hypothetical protein